MRRNTSSNRLSGGNGKRRANGGSAKIVGVAVMARVRNKQTTKPKK